MRLRTSFLQRVPVWIESNVGTAAVLISLLISAWSLYQDNVINDDGVLYLRTAELFSHGDWRGGMAGFPWPFYSWLIALTGRISGLHLEAAAHLLNALFWGLTVYFFITLVRQLGGGTKVCAFAALIVLIQPQLN
ncbi:MAG: hypothetical protein ACREUA_02905, partial [Burkholderiales bacterium]